METPEELRRRARSLLDLAETVERAGRLAWQLEQMPDGSVLVFTKQFSRNGTDYRYAAIKTSNRWNTTGPKSPKNYDSEEFSNWLRGRTVGSGRPVSNLTISVRVEPVCQAHVTVSDDIAHYAVMADPIWASASDSDSGGSRGPY